MRVATRIKQFEYFLSIFECTHCISAGMFKLAGSFELVVDSHVYKMRKHQLVDVRMSEYDYIIELFAFVEYISI